MKRNYLDPAKTYTLEDFIDMRYADNATYYNFSMLEKYKNVEHLSFNLIDDYLENLHILKTILNDTEMRKYKYHPDLLAYDVYGSTQLDFIIMALNDMADPKDFTRKTIYLPYASELEEFLDLVYSSNYNLIQNNRLQNGIDI